MKFTTSIMAAAFATVATVAFAADDFKPAVPVSFEGVVFTGFGFVGGWLAIALVFGILRRLIFGRRRAGVA